jgi:AraC-like DNA-binding protein
MTTTPLSAYIRTIPHRLGRCRYGAATFYHERHEGFTALPHHHGYGQLLLPIAGRMRLSAADEALALGPEWGVWVGAGVEHAVAPLTGELEFLVIDLPADWLTNGVALLNVEASVPSLHVAHDTRWWLMARLLTEEMATEKPGRERVMVGLLEQLAILVARTCLVLEQPEATTRRDAEVWRVVDIMHANYAEPLTVAELARTVGLSERQLERRFKALMGTAPRQHLIAVRVQAAQALLAANVPISTVAMETGFSSPAHLTQAFTRVVGCPPSAYKQRP